MPEGLVQTLQVFWFSCLKDKKLSNFSGSWKAQLLRKVRRSSKLDWSLGKACVLGGIVVGIVVVLDVRVISVKAKSEVSVKAKATRYHCRMSTGLSIFIAPAPHQPAL